VSLREAWERNAEDWLRFARTPGHDRAYELVNLPRFLELVPPPGRATLDVGCGEGRLGAELERRGHRVTGIDGSPTLVERARERHAAVLGDAAAMPFADASFDLAVAFMSLHDVDDASGAIREVGRVLEAGGRFCFALEHFLQIGGDWESRDADAPFRLRDYLSMRPRVFEHERDGIRMLFSSYARPLEYYSRALEEAGLAIEAIREPRAGDEYVLDDPARARWRRIPLFVHVRAVRL
jgi:SAM-dependent methyltransferase